MRQKVGFWHDAFLAYQRQLLQSGTSAPPPSSSLTNTERATKPPLSFTLTEVQKGMARRGEVPAAIELVLCDLLASDQIRSVDQYSLPSACSSSSAASNSSTSLVTNAGRFGRYLLSFVSPRKKLTKFPTGRFVLVEQVEAAANELIQRLKLEEVDVFTMERLMELSQRTKSDLIIILSHIMQSSSPSIVECEPAPVETTLDSPSSSSNFSRRVFKLGSASSQVDHSRAILTETIRHLEQRTREQEQQIAQCLVQARRLLGQNLKPLALLQLQKKKRTLTQLHQLHSQIANLDVLLHHLDAAMSQQEFFQCMKQANQTLKQIQTIDGDAVTALTDDLSDHISQLRLVDQALAAPIHTASENLKTDDEIEAQYQELLQEVEREEKEEGKEKEKEKEKDDRVKNQSVSFQKTATVDANVQASSSPPPYSQPQPHPQSHPQSRPSSSHSSTLSSKSVVLM